MKIDAMKLLVQILFWLALLSVVLNACLIPTRSYPRSVEYSLGEDVFKLLFGAGACVAYAWMLGWVSF